ncbi:MAG TPA: ROK family protein [Bryobacteraceae bacterium]|nr:ROK family protein [Bryobacteraceae bacterium]
MATRKILHAPLTLAIDIGGTGIKMMTLDGSGKPLGERIRADTPHPATPEAVLSVLDTLSGEAGTFDRVSVGFPGVVKRGATLTAHNLDPQWCGYELQKVLERRWKCPVRVANDAAVQGYGAIRGVGVELTITLGTGFGSSLFIDGRLVPGLELAHHPWRKDETYEDYLGIKGLEHLGRKRWNRTLEKAIRQLEALFNYDHLFIGGGNAARIDFQLPRNVTRVPNEDGLLGGAALWRDPTHAERPKEIAKKHRPRGKRLIAQA